jgi:putative peptidoglycan lipid II flippase
MQDTVTPAVVGTVATLLAVPGYYVLIPLMGAQGVALVTTGSIALYAIVLLAIACRRWATGAFEGVWITAWRSVLLSMPGCGMMLAIMQDGSRLLSGLPVLAQQFIILAVGGLMFVGSWLMLSYFFQRHYYWTVLYPFLRRLHPRKPRPSRAAAPAPEASAASPEPSASPASADAGANPEDRKNPAE